MDMALKTKPYTFSKDFEPEVLLLTCTSPSFYSRIGKDLIADRIPHEWGKLLVKAAHEVAEVTSMGPTKMLYVLQRLVFRQNDWKITNDKMGEITEWANELADLGVFSPPDEESVVTSLMPYVERQKFDDAEQAFFEIASNGGNIDELVNKVAEIRDVGKKKVASSLEFGGSLSEDIEVDPRRIRTMLTGISPVDDMVDPGLPCGTFSIGLAGTGGGKSMFLTQLAAYNMLQGLNGLYISLEISAENIDARIVSAVTDVEEELLRMRHKPALTQARDRIAQLRDKRKIGNFQCSRGTREGLTPDDVKVLVDEHEQRIGDKVDILIIDYLDLMSAGVQTSKHKDLDLWRKTAKLANFFADYADQKIVWVWTVSQVTISKEQRKKRGESSFDTDDMAGGREKGRAADFVVAINVSDDNDRVTFKNVKRRFGKGRAISTDCATDFTHGRLVQPACSWETVFGTKQNYDAGDLGLGFDDDEEL
jgi:KaiC/GvpD/RAD55 family RecA-like ATPase